MAVAVVTFACRTATASEVPASEVTACIPTAPASVERGFCVLPAWALEPASDAEVPECGTDGTSRVAALPIVVLSGGVMLANDCSSDQTAADGLSPSHRQDKIPHQPLAHLAAVLSAPPLPSASRDSQQLDRARPQRIALPGVDFGVYRPPRS